MPNVREIDQMVIKIPASSIARPSQIYPNWIFWFENMHLATLIQNYVYFGEPIGIGR
jgi:hypothetical protein